MSHSFDFSSALAAESEGTVATPPPLYRFAENFMLASYDPVADLGLWLHLGTCPDDFGIWEDQILIALPHEDGLLWSYSYFRTPPEKRPAGANLAFRCIEPFRRWQVTCDGVGVRTAYADTMRGRVRDGAKELFTIELDIESVAPAWDNHASAKAGSGRGNMEEQAWAKEHYQQLFRATGTVKLADRTIAFKGTGVRDHSRGQRGHAYDKFGGHNLWTACYPSGKAFGMQRMWTPEGEMTLNVAFVYIDGQFHHADVIDRPFVMKDLKLRDEELTLVLRSPLGEHHLHGRTLKTMFTTLNTPYSFSIGADIDYGRGIFAPGFAKWTWDGEDAHGLTERSGRLSERQRNVAYL